MDLIETAEWLKSELRLPLASSDITLAEFRTLVLLNRKGPLTMVDVSRERRTGIANMKKTSDYLERRGWVRRVVVTLPPVSFERSHKAKATKDHKRKGRRIGVMAALQPADIRTTRLRMAGGKRAQRVIVRFPWILRRVGGMTECMRGEWAVALPPRDIRTTRLRMAGGKRAQRVIYG